MLITQIARDTGALSPHLMTNSPDAVTTGAFDRVKWDAFAQAGILGLTVPNEFGGQGLRYMEAVDRLISIGEGCDDNGILLAIGAHLWAGIMPICLFGSPDQKRNIIPALTDGRKIIAFAATEQDAGSDIGAINTLARKVDGGYVLSGKKTMITNAPVADIFIVLAKIESADFSGLTAFIVTSDSAGVTVPTVISKMGLDGAMMGGITLSNCFVSDTQLLGMPGMGLMVFLKAMEIERSMILSSAIGRMMALRRISLTNASGRSQFGRSIIDNQYVQDRLVDMEVSIALCTAMIKRVAELLDSGVICMKEASITKMVISKNWEAVALHAMSIGGGRSYLAGSCLEKEVRDSLGSRFFSGTEETQKNTIFRFMRA